MSSGNYLVDSFENDNDFHRMRHTCDHCSGSGRVMWADIDRGYEKMADEIAFRIYKADKNGYPIKSFRQMMAISRQVKREGCECQRCDGQGEI